MKKLLALSAVLAVGVTSISTVPAHASDPFTFVPACILSLDPTLQYETVSFTCQEFTDPDTGIHYNAISVVTPKP